MILIFIRLLIFEAPSVNNAEKDLTESTEKPPEPVNILYSYLLSCSEKTNDVKCEKKAF